MKKNVLTNNEPQTLCLKPQTHVRKSSINNSNLKYVKVGAVYLQALPMVTVLRDNVYCFRHYFKPNTKISLMQTLPRPTFCFASELMNWLIYSNVGGSLPSLPCELQ